MSKGSAPPAPDYTPIAAANQAAADRQFQLGEEQLAWSKEQYANEAPAALDYLKSMTANSDAQTKNAQTAEDEYTSVFQPLRKQFAQEASDYNSPARATQNAGMAEADVASQFDAARTTAQSSLESFGIDPSQTRFGALDLGSRVQQAAATASAGTNSRLQTEATGLGLKSQAINIGSGLPAQVSGSYSGATSSGASGIGATTSLNSTFGNLMGTPTQYDALANQSNAGAASALNLGYSNQLAGQQMVNQAAGNTMSGVGSLVGAAAGVAAIAI